ncbi:hypothetical protein GCM10010401_06190 [Rarobacter faecitabidus]|uniref:PRC-barrel domain protein n=1 Tax=Rarobacter faecitabidus TaxID=13243 RepID=A0A542ZTU6_RARFA|nr:PRC-barrel domain containing protein [Rarobacter faecitabidus]TQL63630.1 hypothetical protein FB461_0097 [Rarobacter faecitabidus]
MILSDLLDRPVRDGNGRTLGHCVDARFVLEPGDDEVALGRLRLVGLIVSPRTRTSFMGFERTSLTAPWPLAQLLRRRHKGTFLALWSHVAAVEPEVVTLAEDYIAYDPSLSGDDQ